MAYTFLVYAVLNRYFRCPTKIINNNVSGKLIINLQYYKNFGTVSHNFNQLGSFNKFYLVTSFISFT